MSKFFVQVHVSGNFGSALYYLAAFCFGSPRQQGEAIMERSGMIDFASLVLLLRASAIQASLIALGLASVAAPRAGGRGLQRRFASQLAILTQAKPTQNAARVPLSGSN